MSEDNSTPHNAGTPDTPKPVDCTMAERKRELFMKREKLRLLTERLFLRLAELGVAKVIAKFDGFGDDGQIEHIKAKMNEPGKYLALKQASFEGRSLYAAIEELIYGQLDIGHQGWQDEGGSLGKYVLDVPRRKITEKFAWRHAGAQDELQDDET